MSEGVWPEIIRGDCRSVLRDMPAESVHCVITSPPYWGLRSYLPDGHQEKRNEIGLEATPELHIAALLEVFKLVWRVLRKDGTLWCNYGDCYACAPNGRKAADIEGDDRTFRDKPFSTASRPGGPTGDGGPRRGANRNGAPCPINLKPKDLVGMPWRLALALQADGWWLRSDIIWSKVNPMPESVTDRPTRSHEYLFLLTKSERYFMDMDAIREPLAEVTVNDRRMGTSGTHRPRYSADGMASCPSGFTGANPAGRNRRTVWTIPTQATPEAHFATFPEALVEPCILAGTSERGVCPTCGAPWERVREKGDLVATSPQHDKRAYGQVRHDEPNDQGGNRARDGHRSKMAYENKTTGWRSTCAHQHTEDQLFPALVLDPFAGSGTVSRVASRLGRRSIGIELSEEYVEKIARKRTSQGSLGL